MGFSFLLTQFDESSMLLKVKFEKPLSVSIGSKPDIMLIKFMEPDLFISKETGKTLMPDI